MSGAKPSAPAAIVALYEKLVATQPNVERKGAAIPYTAVNGNMFSQLDADGTLGLRLPEDARAAFREKYGAALFESYGVVKKEYVAVPHALLKKTAELAPYFAIGYRYAAALKPKPSTRKKERPAGDSR